MEDHRAPVTARPIPWDSLKFLPIPQEDRETTPWDDRIEANFLCSYCSALIDVVDRAYHAPQSQNWYQNIHQRTIFNKRITSYQELHQSAINGCHLCSIVVGGVHEAWLPNGYDVTTADLEMFLSAVPRQHTVVFRIRVSDVKYPKDACVIPVWDSSRASITLGSRSIFTASKECFDVIRSWLDCCLKEHAGCPRSESAWIPTRLIEIQSLDTVRLVDTTHFDDSVPYYALSYCWGRQRVLMTTRSQVEAFKEAIPFEDLPLTIRDAIRVVYNLGGPGSYIWVDSICIIQDDTEDWNREAATMCDIYHNAKLTIAALGASNATEGLFARRDPLISKECCIPSKHEPSRSIYVGKFGLTGYGMPAFNRAPLHKRGWVFQERSLSPRTLFFSSYLYWECDSRFEVESAIGDSTQNNIRQSAQSLSTVDNAVLASKDGLGSYGKVPTQLEAWHKSLKAFTSRDLTIATDRLPAISGVITDLERRTGWNHVNGLFVNYLAFEMTWMGDWNRKSSGRLQGAPTWSWTSTQTPVRYPDIVSYQPINGVNLMISESNNSVLEAESPLFELSADAVRGNSEDSFGIPWIVKDLEHKHRICRTNSQLDIVDHIPKGPHFFLPLIMVQSSNNPKGVLAICLGLAFVQSSKSTDSYERFGLLGVGIEDSYEVKWPESMKKKIHLV